MNKKCFLISLGCSKNLVDSEVMLGLLSRDGFQISKTAEEADLLLVNTCGFIQPALEEGIDEILALARIKKENPTKKLVVTGCMVQRYGKKLQAELPEVDLFLGTEGFHRIVDKINQMEQAKKPVFALRSPSYIMTHNTPRRLSTPSHRAFLKITEGCINRCSYCLIPSIRGNLRSRSIDDLVFEACALQESGVKELTLIGQDLTAYGSEQGDNGPRLPELLTILLKNCSIPWIRLLYLYPSKVDDSVLAVMQDNPRIVPYLDVPFQHVSDHVLHAMKRPYGKNDIALLLKKIREQLSPVAIRTTFMVGFPGETEDDHAELIDFIKSAKLDHVGVFTYCNEEGSAASEYADQVPDEEKEARRQQIMEIQADISFAQNNKWVGHNLKVLVEGVSSETDLLLEGRTKYQAPDVDGCVYITDGVSSPGEIVNVKITEAHTYDLVGEIVGTQEKKG